MCCFIAPVPFIHNSPSRTLVYTSLYTGAAGRDTPSHMLRTVKLEIRKDEDGALLRLDVDRRVLLLSPGLRKAASDNTDVLRASEYCASSIRLNDLARAMLVSLLGRIGALFWIKETDTTPYVVPFGSYMSIGPEIMDTWLEAIPGFRAASVTPVVRLAMRQLMAFGLLTDTTVLVAAVASVVCHQIALEKARPYAWYTDFVVNHAPGDPGFTALIMARPLSGWLEAMGGHRAHESDIADVAAMVITSRSITADEAEAAFLALASHYRFNTLDEVAGPIAEAVTRALGRDTLVDALYSTMLAVMENIGDIPMARTFGRIVQHCEDPVQITDTMLATAYAGSNIKAVRFIMTALTNGILEPSSACTMLHLMNAASTGKAEMFNELRRDTRNSLDGALMNAISKRRANIIRIILCDRSIPMSRFDFHMRGVRRDSRDHTKPIHEAARRLLNELDLA